MAVFSRTRCQVIARNTSSTSTTGTSNCPSRAACARLGRQASEARAMRMPQATKRMVLGNGAESTGRGAARSADTIDARRSLAASRVHRGVRPSSPCTIAASMPTDPDPKAGKPPFAQPTGAQTGARGGGEAGGCHRMRGLKPGFGVNWRFPPRRYFARVNEREDGETGWGGRIAALPPRVARRRLRRMKAAPARTSATSCAGQLAGWGGRIRTSECRYQKPVPYHLATPQQRQASLGTPAQDARLDASRGQGKGGR